MWFAVRASAYAAKVLSWRVFALLSNEAPECGFLQVK